MRSSTCFVLSALSGSQIVYGQWGAIAEPPLVALGNHYHWQADKSLPILTEYEIHSHINFFKSDDYDHELHKDFHHDVHEHATLME